MVQRKFVIMGWLLLVMLVLSACSDPLQPDSDEPVASSESPVTEKPKDVDLTIFNTYNMTESWMNSMIIDPVKAQLPHITLRIENKVDNDTLDKLLVAGKTPDLIIVKADALSEYIDKELHVDMNPLIKSHGFDLARLDAGSLDAVEVWGDQSEHYMLPYFINLRALYYNKDIFDKFNVAYPEDAMTWQQAIDLAAEVARLEDGTNYYGLSFLGIRTMASAMSAPFIDVDTNRATVHSMPWQTIFALGKKVYDIPGASLDIYAEGKAVEAFLNHQNLAMIAGKNMFDQLAEAPSSFRWDLATYPSFEEKPGVYGSDVVQGMMVTSASPHKDEAFKVLSVLLSDEVQRSMSMQGMVSSLDDAAIREAFARELPFLAEKNIEGIFKSGPAAPPKTTRYDDIAYSAINKGFKKMIEEGQDVNTALMQIEETINQGIEKESSAE